MFCFSSSRQSGLSSVWLKTSSPSFLEGLFQELLQSWLLFFVQRHHLVHLGAVGFLHCILLLIGGKRNMRCFSVGCCTATVFEKDGQHWCSTHWNAAFTHQQTCPNAITGHNAVIMKGSVWKSSRRLHGESSSKGNFSKSNFLWKVDGVPELHAFGVSAGWKVRLSPYVLNLQHQLAGFAPQAPPTFECFFFKALSSFCCFFISFR